MKNKVGLCAKLTTVAIIENKGEYWVSTNYCNNPQKTCPRKDLPTGVGYEMCKDICQQSAHAEVNVCRIAGDNAKGGILYLIGHTYCCDNCKKVMKEYGIEKIVIGESPPSWKNK